MEKKEEERVAEQEMLFSLVAREDILEKKDYAMEIIKDKYCITLF